jgi:hypothetical protein
MTVGQLLEAMPDGSELAEWRAYLEAEGQVQALILKGTDSRLAHELIWGPPKDTKG